MRLDDAERTYRQILGMLQLQDAAPGQIRGAALDQADDWYRQALAIKQDLGDRPGWP